ncbi:TRAP transporter substrate-binding protein [Psychrobacillus lasiicapitis]|nr:TRAP transporter substrate-binding protein DctP [Psychrobacillus lasiicapitis]GGA19732.1 ABC transporter substrate-binding protein [Psychrobacillus lasiicapitis]
MKKLLFLCLILLMILTGCSKGNDSVAKAGDNKNQKTQTIKIAYNLPKEHATGVYFEVLAEEIDKKTKDTSIHLIPSTFSNGQLYNDTQLPDALATGGVQIGQITTGFLAGGEAKPLQVTDLPLLFNSWESMWTAEDGEFGDIFNTQFEKLGMKLIGWPSYGTVELYGSKPIKVPKDVSGQIMRGFGQGASLMLEELGASPVSMSSQEIYQALEHGAIDGYTTGPSSVIDRSLYEVTKYGTDMTLLSLSFQGATNLNWWESLPEDVQKAIEEASEIAQEQSRKEAKEKDLVYKKQLVEHGIELYTPSETEMGLWKEAASNRYKAYVESSGEIGERLLELVEKANEQ